MGALALEFVSSVGIQACSNKMKGQCNLFSFHFQDDGSVFLLDTKVNDDSNVYLCSKRAFSDVVEGVFHKNRVGMLHTVWHPMLAEYNK